jgi:hypothetical protein
VIHGEESLILKVSGVPKIIDLLIVSWQDKPEMKS